MRVDELLYAAYREWAGVNGHDKPNAQLFGRDLRAVLPGRLKVTQPGSGGDLTRAYQGIDLTKDVRADIAVREAERSKR